MIRYQSLSMPIMELSDVITEKEGEKVNVDGDDEKSNGSVCNNSPVDTTKNQ